MQGITKWLPGVCHMQHIKFSRTLSMACCLCVQEEQAAMLVAAGNAIIAVEQRAVVTEDTVLQASYVHAVELEVRGHFCIPVSHMCWSVWGRCAQQATCTHQPRLLVWAFRIVEWEAVEVL
jgi:hypothetical protein